MHRLLFCFLLAILPCSVFAAPMLKGVNLAGAEFAAEKIPGVHNQHYIYPSLAIIAAYADFGMNVIRVPFLWERMQPRLNGPLNTEELKRLDAVVSQARQKRLTVILDLHNYGTYRAQLIGSKQVPESAFIQFWELLAVHYRNQPHVAFGIMNEPHKQDAATWARIAKHTLLAIRKAEVKQLILIPGTIYTGAHSWNNKVGKKSNGEALADLRDPADNMLIEFHHYFDHNYSGTHASCTPPEVTQSALMQATEWLNKTGHKGFLAEFGSPQSADCLKSLRTALQHIEDHSSQWGGWTYWGASEWFGDYMFNIYPVSTDKYPQLSVLRDYLN